MRTFLRIVLCLLILSIIPIELFAGDRIETEHVRFNLREDVRACRYQLNGEADDQWIIIDMDDPVTEWVSSDREHDRLYYQYTLDGKNWSNSFELYYNSKTDTWDHLFDALATTTGKNDQMGNRISFGGIYIKPLGDMPQSMYESGLGGTLRIDTAFGEYQLFGEISYWKGDSVNALIETVHTGLAGIGFGYPIPFGSLSLVTEIGAGLLIEVPVHSERGVMSCFDGYGKAGMSISSPISDNQEIFVRGHAMFFSGVDEIAIEATVTAGTSLML